MRSLRLGCAIGALMVASTAVYAQETTGTIRGDVLDSAGNPVANATVTVVHQPSGSRSTSTTDADGTFNASGLRIGGPYEVTVAAAGLETATATIPSLSAGQPQRVGVTLFSAAETITVTAVRARSSIELATGPVTSLDQDDIQGIASVNRDIRDLVRRDPYATLDLTNSRAVSIAGQNPRFNKFSVDGVQFSDDFGLNNGGLPTARGPVPLDAICELAVQIAPTDITEGDFQGGTINTVLCSGNNEFTGGAFYTYSNDSLTGDQARGSTLDLDFSSKSYGGFIRGPIIRDKLFFSLTAERLREGEPGDFGVAGEGFANVVPNLTRAQVDNIKSIAQSLYGFDTLDTPQTYQEEDDKLVAKIDANLGDDHRAAVTYIYNKGTNGVEASSSTSATTPRLALQSNGYLLSERVHSGVFQLNSDWSDDFSTEARISYRDYKRGQIPFNGRDFGQFTVCLDPVSNASTATGGGLTGCSTGVPTIVFGPDISRQANALDTTNLNIQFQASYTPGAHNFKALVERGDVSVNNLFVQRASGDFYFDSIADFQARRANRLIYQNAINGDINSGAGIFDYTTWTFGLQDTWDLNDTLTLQYGVRYDLFEQDDRAEFNPNFAARHGFGNNANLTGRGLVQPRVGVTWQPLDRLNLRGSAGRFGGGTPDVYISNSFSNNGVALNNITIQRAANGTNTFTNGVPTAVGIGALNDVTGGTGIPSVVDQFLATSTATLPFAATNALDPDFKLPSQWRFALSAAYEANLGFLGDGWLLGADFLYGTVSNGAVVTDLRVRSNGTLPDGRPRYAAIDNSNNADFLLTNSKDGETKIAVARFDKEFDNGLSIGAIYTYQDITAVSELTSSTASSNYANNATSDPNIATLGRSNDETRHTAKFNVGFRHAFFGDNETRIDLFGEWRTGRPFSYTFEDLSTAQRSPVFGTLGDDRRYLLYVPTGTSDPLVSYDSAATATALDNFINNSKLSKYRGSIAPKNLGRSPSFTKIDLRFTQDVPFVWGKFKAFVDVENVLNMIDSDWGSLRQVGFPYFAPLVQVSCANAACSQYRYQNFRAPNEQLQTRVSLYQIRVGARFEF
jgi:hypothetical protein